MIRELTHLQKWVEDTGSPQTKAAASSISLRDAPRPILSIQQEARVSSRLGGLQLPAWLLARQISKGLIEPLLSEIKDRVRLARQQVEAWIQEALEALTGQQEKQEIELSRPSLPRHARISTPEQQAALQDLQDWISAVPMKEMQR